MTAKMLLHWSPRSPFVRKVMIARMNAACRPHGAAVVASDRIPN
jgi:hypothetical protein